MARKKRNEPLALLGIITERKSKLLLDAGWRRLDYQVDGEQMWLAPSPIEGKIYFRESVAFDHADRMEPRV